MSKNKNNQAIWNLRIKKSTSTLFQKVGNSIDIDKKLFREDIAGSIVHVEMLFRQKIISFKIKNKIIYGLNKIKKEIIKKNRVGDHIWYISNTEKFKKHYPKWKQKYSNLKIIEGLINDS